MSESPPLDWALSVLRGASLPGAPLALHGTIKLGRGSDCDVVLADPAVSRHHARLERQGEQVLISDLGSRHGTLVNGMKLAVGAAQVLRADDRVAIGPWLFRVDDRRQHTSARFELSDHTVRISPVGAVGELAAQRLQALLEFTRELVRISDAQYVLDLLCRFARGSLDYERAAVVSGGGAALRVRALSARPDGATRPYSISLIAATSEDQPAQLEARAGQSISASMVGVPVQRALCVALARIDEQQLYLYLDATDARRADDAGAPLALALARIAALALSHLARARTELERARLVSELQAARDAQGRLLPASSGRVGAIEYALELQPGGQVAGDFVDVFAVDGGVALVIGDVSGSGASAGIVMAAVVAQLRALLRQDPDVARAALGLNTDLCRWLAPGRFVTAWLGLLREDGTLDCVDAGHGHVLRLSGDSHVGGAEVAGAAPLGVMPETDYRSEQLTLGLDDALLLYTDGVIESRTEDGDAFGAGRLGMVLAGHRAHGAATVARISAALRLHLGTTGGDDATLLWVRRVAS